jgi:hypothetical protein
MIIVVVASPMNPAIIIAVGSASAGRIEEAATRRIPCDQKCKSFAATKVSHSKWKSLQSITF